MNTDLKHYYLQQLGIEVWKQRESSAKPDELNRLAKEVASCIKCSLHKCRTQTVFARGNPTAKLMVVGEAPGFYEDKQGLPFVGKAGMLLDKMLLSIGFEPEQVYIANVIKCRPPDNRDPSNEEIIHCSKYLAKQIDLIKPSLLLAVGRFAGQFLLKKNLAMHQMRAQVHYYQQIPCIVSYHPAYLLRKPGDKKKAYRDLMQLRNFL